MSNSTLILNRRQWLASAGTLASGLPFRVLGTTDVETTAQLLPAQRSVHDGMAYVSFDGTGTPWQAPLDSNRTRDYVNSLSREEYLRRHWQI